MQLSSVINISQEMEKGTYFFSSFKEQDCQFFEVTRYNQGLNEIILITLSCTATVKKLGITTYNYL